MRRWLLLTCVSVIVIGCGKPESRPVGTMDEGWPQPSVKTALNYLYARTLDPDALGDLIYSNATDVVTMSATGILYTNGVEAGTISANGTNINWYPLVGTGAVSLATANEAAALSALLVTEITARDVADTALGTDIVRNADRIAQHQLQYLVDRDMAADGLVDAWFDVFEDETGVATDSCVDQTYDGVGEFYEKTVSEGGVYAGLVGQWSMDDNSANTIVEDTTATYDGSMSANTDQHDAVGKLSGALEFSTPGSDGAELGTASALDSATYPNGFTVMAWVYVHSEGEAGAGRIIGRNDSNGLGGFWFGVNDETAGEVRLISRVYHSVTHAQTYSATYFDINVWHHVALVYNEDAAKKNKLYINATLAGGTQQAGSGSLTAQGSEHTLVGNNCQSIYNRDFDGLIDDVRFYSEPLSITDIQSIYNSGDGDIEALAVTEAEGTDAYTLVSTPQPVYTTPNMVRATIWFEDDGGFLLNDDTVLAVSSDAGSTWDTATLARTPWLDITGLSDSFAYNADVTLTGTSTDIVWKAEVNNAKTHAISILVD
jgi:hypothetical protein